MKEVACSCPYCGSMETTSGYGYAAGPLGSYTFCDSCGELIELVPDLDGLTEEESEKLLNDYKKFKPKLYLIK